MFMQTIVKSVIVASLIAICSSTQIKAQTGAEEKTEAKQNNNFNPYLVKKDDIVRDEINLLSPEHAKHGMVATRNKIATDVGVAILKQGGNAVDAAVAVGFTLAVTLPQAGNMGGGGFMVIHLAEQKKTIAIDYREMAPAKAHADMMLDIVGNVDQQKTRFHGLSSGVPGSVMGMEFALKKYGTMSLKELMVPAIKLAEDGFVVSPHFSKTLKAYSGRLKKWPSSRAIFYKKNGQPYESGETLVQTDLAKSLKIIANMGSKGFYQGEVAEKIVAAIQEAGGVMSLEDLSNYKVKLRKPVSTTYRGYEVVSMPPPSSGGIHLIQILNILENIDLQQSGHNTATTIHYMAEAMKYAFADRSEYLGDSDFYKVPSRALTDKRYAKSIFNKIDPQRATPSSKIKPGQLAPYESDQTTHYSVLDRWGNAISTTTTLNFAFGSGLIAAGTGIMMNNEMDDFSAKAGQANAYGLLGGSANAIKAGKRPLSSMTPTIVFKDGKPFLITGSLGGSRIITSTLQILLNIIDHQMNIAEASHALRIHHQWYPDYIRTEKGLNPDTKGLLEAKGHKVQTQSSMGDTQSIMSTEQGLFGSSDPRDKGGKTAGH